MLLRRQTPSIATALRRAAIGRGLLPIVALALAGSLWGLTVPLSKLGMDWLDAGWLAVARFAIAAPLLALIARRRLRTAITPRILVAGAVGYGAVIVLQNAGIERTSVTHAALIVGAVPVLVAVIAALFGRSTAAGTTWAGSLVALAGVGLVAGGGGAGTSMTGDLLVLGSVSMSAAFIVIQPSLLRGRDAGAVTAVQLAGGGLAALPFAVLTEGMPAAPATATPVVAVLALALTGTALAFWLFAWAQSHVPAEVAGAFVNLEPLVGAVTGAVAFHDAVGTPQMLGGSAILLGIGLGALSGFRPPGEHPQGNLARWASVPLPRNRPAVPEEAARRTVVRERRRPHDAARPVAHRPSSHAAHVRRHPTRTHRIDEHAVPPQRIRKHERERVESGLRD
jgi:drug/metabolite transporter (DMT)-like permease